MKLILWDGPETSDRNVGSVVRSIGGRIVVNTEMTDCKEILIDLSYCSHVLVMTNPIVSSCGIHTHRYLNGDYAGRYMSGSSSRRLRKSRSGLRMGA